MADDRRDAWVQKMAAVLDGSSAKSASPASGPSPTTDAASSAAPATSEDSPEVTMAWADDIQVKHVEKGVLRIGNWIENCSSGPLGAGVGRGLLMIKDSEGSQIKGDYTTPVSGALKPGGKTWTSEDAKLPAGVYYIELLLLVNDQPAERRFGGLTVEMSGQSYSTRFAPGKKAPKPVLEDRSTVKMAWAGDIQVKHVEKGVVRIGNWIENLSPGAVNAGVGRGLLTIKDSEGTQIKGGYTTPASKALKPRGKTWTSEDAKLAAGTYYIELLLLVYNEVVERRFGRLIVEVSDQSYSTRFAPDKKAPTPVLEDRSTVKMLWAGDIQVKHVEKGVVRIGNWIENLSPGPVSAGVGRGLLTIKDSQGWQIKGDYTTPVSKALKPRGKTWTSEDAKLSAGVYYIELALLVYNEVVQRRFGELTIEVSDQSYSIRFAPDKKYAEATNK